MPGDIGLVGGEEFRVGCEDMDREIMRVSGQQPSESWFPKPYNRPGEKACCNWKLRLRFK